MLESSPLLLIIAIAVALVWFTILHRMRKSFGKFGQNEAPEVLIFVAGSAVALAVAVPYLVRWIQESR